MEEQTLIQALQELQQRVVGLGPWSSTNARELGRINDQFLAAGCSLLKLVGRKPAGFIIQQDDTTQEVGRAQASLGKKRSDLAFHEKYYVKAKRHLTDEIPEIIAAYNRYKTLDSSQ